MGDLGPGVVLAVGLIVFGLIRIVRGPIAEAAAARLRGSARAQSDPELLAEVDTLKTRLAEVEERLDFAERLLAKVDAADQLPGSVER
jgi:hypothetical protein